MRWKLSLIEIFLLAVALGVDCFVVSFSQGLFYKNNRLITAMQIIGFVGADYTKFLIEPYSKLVVFAVFMLLGMQFIFESVKKEEKQKIQCLSFGCLISLGIATSIDALVSGVSLNYTMTSLSKSCFIIGGVSFVMSLIGFYITSLFKNIKINYLQFLGGLILIFLGAKVLIF